MVRLAHVDALYERIAAEILRRVASGKLRPGDRLPPIRQAAGEWGVNLNTVARAYAALAERGILETRAGGGAVVAQTPPAVSVDGLDPVSQARAERPQTRLGSGVLEVLAGRLRALPESVTLEVVPTDSLDGLFARARGTTDFAGCQLLDPETGEHNVSFVRRMLPGEPVLLVTLAHRQQGLIGAAGAPKQVQRVHDLGRPGISIVNRRRGSGARVVLDDVLTRAQIDPATLRGYDREEVTDLAVAGTVAAGVADASLGILTALGGYDTAESGAVRSAEYCS